MRTAMAFLIGLSVLWTSYASAETVSRAGEQAANPDYVMVPCDQGDASLDTIVVAQADAPILLAAGNGSCRVDKKSGGCANPGAPCGKKDAGTVCTTVEKGGRSCQCR
jgi:hypothetical protein